MINKLLAHWQSNPLIGPNIVTLRIRPARQAKLTALPAHLHPLLAKALRERGITQLYSHQAEAWQAAQQGENFILTSGTSSGKTLAFSLPVLDGLLNRPEDRALYLYPTKALAQDQLDEVITLAPQVTPAVYDGDTPQSKRATIRNKSRLVLSNPDMLHAGILPHHTKWAEFFHNLRFVVLDEIHVYRGVFGAHVANVLRRLRRVAAFYGSWPIFMLASATIANAPELAEKLIEAPLRVIDQDGSATGSKAFMIYNPPVVNPELGIRRNLIDETVRLAADIAQSNLQAILFARTRRTVELLLTALREEVRSKSRKFSKGDPPSSENSYRPRTTQASTNDEWIRGYRSGYLPTQRREIENALRSGEARLVTATTALELGIDIGNLQVAVLAGYPGTIASLIQQSGRAGRGQTDGLAILVTSAAPIDQYLARHPDFLLSDRATPERAFTNPNNLLILLSHIRCAAFELPFTRGESFGRLPANETTDFLDFLVQEGVIHPTSDRYFWMSDQYPAQAISLRSVEAQTITLLDSNGISVGIVDQASANWMVHPGAVYLHEGQAYLVRELDREQHLAHLQPGLLDYYTEPQQETQVAILTINKQQPITNAEKAFGDLQITTQTTGFRKVRWHSREVLGMETLDMPATELITTGMWFWISDSCVEQLSETGLWNSSPNDYGSRWPEIRARVRARDSFRCQACGKPEDGKAHDVHHIQPFRSFRSLEEANRLENLVTLCQSCHRRAETAVRVRTGLAGAAYAIGHLAPLFIMCDSGDLGVHYDLAAPFTSGKPTIAIYDQAVGGIGLSEHLYDVLDVLFREAYHLVKSCQCQDGCPSCVGPGGENGYGGKPEALALLASLANRLSEPLDFPGTD